MSGPVVTVREDTSLADVVATLEEHQLRRVPVVNEDGFLTGIIAQADVARSADEREVGEMVREVSEERR